MWFIIIPLLLIIIPDIYIWNYFMRNEGTIVNIIYWVPLILAIISAACGMAGLYQERFMKLFFIVLLCSAFPKLVFALVSFIGKMTGFIIPY